ncbi:MAG: hypothetical protein V1915_02770 [Candidatus Bathyarchaeota archaeon]
MEATLDRPNLRASVSPARANPLIICNGPIAREIGVSSGWGLGATIPTTSPNRRPNMTLSRTVLLCLYNIGFIEKKPLDHINYLGTCFAENEDASPWEPLHVERGFNKDTSTVTVKSEATLSGHSVPGGRFSGIFSLDIRNWAESFVETSPHAISALGSTGIIIFQPARAKWFADNGMNKDDIRKYLYDTCKWSPQKEWYPYYPPETRDDIVRNAFARVPPWTQNLDRVPVFPNYGKDIWVVVAGGQVIRGFGAAAMSDHGFDTVVTKPIALADGTPAKSVHDFRQLS